MLAAALFVGCTTRPVQERPATSLERRFDIDFIEIGVTTRDEIVAQLGEPFYSFDDGRILGYFLARRSGRTQATRRSECTRVYLYGYCRTEHQLMLVFDERGVVARSAYLVASGSART